MKKKNIVFVYWFHHLNNHLGHSYYPNHHLGHPNYQDHLQLLKRKSLIEELRSSKCSGIIKYIQADTFFSMNPNSGLVLFKLVYLMKSLKGRHRQFYIYRIFCWRR